MKIRYLTIRARKTNKLILILVMCWYCSLFFKAELQAQTSDTLYNKNIIKINLFKNPFLNFIPNYNVLSFSYEHLLTKKHTLNFDFQYEHLVDNIVDSVISYTTSTINTEKMEVSYISLIPHFKYYIINNKPKYPRGCYIGAGLPFYYYYGETDYYSITTENSNSVNEVHYIDNYSGVFTGVSMNIGSQVFLSKRFLLEFQLSYELLKQFNKSDVTFLIDDGQTSPLVVEKQPFRAVLNFGFAL